MQIKLSSFPAAAAATRQLPRCALFSRLNTTINRHKSTAPVRFGPVVAENSRHSSHPSAQTSAHRKFETKVRSRRVRTAARYSLFELTELNEPRGWVFKTDAPNAKECAP